MPNLNVIKTSVQMEEMFEDIKLLDYLSQKSQWPERGKSIVAQYNQECILLYQAFCPAIANAAILHQDFVTNNPGFDPGRMTWVKPNFLWMMFRSDWAQKKNQEKILAFWVNLNWFTTCLSEAKLSGRDKNCKSSPVVVQWDPDHTPGGGKNSLRRDIQIGLRKEKALEWSLGICGPAIKKILDLTPLVHSSNNSHKQSNNFLMPEEKYFEYYSESIDLRLLT